MVEIALTSFTEAKLTTSDVLFWDKHLTLMNWNQSEHYFAFWMKSLFTISFNSSVDRDMLTLLFEKISVKCFFLLLIDGNNVSILQVVIIVWVVS